jgi:hypothetical protein
MKRLARTAFGVTLVGLDAASLFTVKARLLSEYISSNPRTPIAETGQVNPYNAHGVIVYFSDRQQNILNLTSIMGVALLASGAFTLRNVVVPPRDLSS